MSTILSKASNAISTWNEVRNNNSSVINYLNQGACFLVSRADYALWEMRFESLSSNTDFKIHAYLGLVMNSGQTNFSISLFLVDSETDKLEVSTHESEYLIYLKESPYLLGLTGAINVDTSNSAVAQITPKEALKGSFKWHLYKNQWVDSQTDMVQILKIPFHDFQHLFADSTTENLCLAFALKEKTTDPEINDIDLMLWGHSDSLGIVWKDNPTDFIQPCPPYCEVASNYQLLSYSTN